MTYDQFAARFLSIREQQEGMRRDHGEVAADNWAGDQLTKLVDMVVMDDDYDVEDEKRFHFLNFVDSAEAPAELKAWIESLSDGEWGWYLGMPEWMNELD
jgi:hypothetical protein